MMGISQTGGELMSDEIATNRAVVLSFLEVLGRGNVDGAFALTAPSLQWFNLSSRAFTPREEMKAMIAWAFDEVLAGPIRLEVDHVTAEDDRVAVMSRGFGTTKRGDAYNNMYHFLFRVNDGLIDTVWEYNDTALAARVFAAE
jgi:ketosteroid isomerase-like protein